MSAISTNGNLSISGSGKLTVTANGNGDVYGIYADKGVTISAPLDLTVGKTDVTKNGSVYGIYTKSGAISLSGEDKTVTATGGKETAYGVYNAAKTSSATDNGNITIGGKLTVSLSNGEYNRGIYTDGGVITLDATTLKIPGGFYYGIYNQKGNVVIKNNSNVTLTSDTASGNGIYAELGGDLIIKNSTVKVSAKGYAASVEKGALSITNSTVDLTLDEETYCVVNTVNNAANKIDLSGSGSVTITASGNQSNAMIGGKVSISTGTKLEKGDYNSNWENYKGEYDGSSKTVLQFVHETTAPTTYTVSFDANGGTGTMADVTGISGSYTLPTCTFTAPSDKQFKGWATSADGSVISGTTYEVSSDTTFYAIWEPIPVTTYSLTTQVNGGHGTISASKTGLAAGSTETVIFTPDAGYEIDTVTVNGVATGVLSNVLDVTMDADKTVVVTYKAIEYNITVTDGKATIGAGSGISKAAAGTAVTLTANAAPDGKVFDKWVVESGGITLADANSATTTFTMPAEAVSVKATYKNTPVTTYSLTTQVNGGHGTISASKTGLAAGSTETITFTPDAGYKIDTVTVNGTATSVSGNTLNVTMNENKTVVVTYKAIEYNITVTDGKATIGAGSEISKAAQGTTVTLTANAAPDGKVFDKWVVESGSITLADVNSATTTFTMPASAVSVKATYKNTPVTTYSLTTQVNGGHGTISASKTGLAAGSTETVIFTPDAGYKIDTVTVNGVETGVLSNVLDVTMDADKTVVVTYKAIPHTHTYGSEWKNDADNHWHECACGDKKDTAAHTAGEWIIDTPATATTSGSKHKECTVCGYTMTTETIPATGGGEHTHSYGTEWKYDGANHWHECACGDKADTAAHSFQWVIDKAATKEATGIKHEECTVCGAKRSENTVIDKLPDGGNTGNTGSGDNNTNKPGKDDSTKSPQTGDSSNLIGWLAALFVSGGVLTVLGLNGKKRKESEAE